MRRTLACVALAIAGFTFGFAGCGDDNDESPRDSGTVTTFEDTTTNGTTDGTSTEDTTTNGTTDGTTTDDNGARTNEDDAGNSGKGRGDYGGGEGDREGSPPPL